MAEKYVQEMYESSKTVVRCAAVVTGVQDEGSTALRISSELLVCYSDG